MLYGCIMKTQIRLKITSHMCNNISYITITDGNVRYYGQTEIPLALANLSNNAAELRFALQDAKYAADARLAVLKYASPKKVEII